MKLPRLIALHYGLTAILLTSSMAVFAETKIADAKNEIIDMQQKMTQEEMDAAKKAAPYNEQRPAANTSQEKHSTESPKGSMIKEQMKATDKEIDDAKAAKPINETRPAATTSQEKDSTESPKGGVKKEIKNANAIKPRDYDKPAGSVYYN